jgi:DNA-binding XRE family transcriptional regulator
MSHGIRSIAAMQTASTPTRTTPAVVLNRSKLDELRRANGIQTEAELARIIGVSPATLWRVTTGEVNPSNGFIARVLLAFPHASMSTLFEVVNAA